MAQPEAGVQREGGGLCVVGVAAVDPEPAAQPHPLQWRRASDRESCFRTGTSDQRVRGGSSSVLGRHTLRRADRHWCAGIPRETPAACALRNAG